MCSSDLIIKITSNCENLKKEQKKYVIINARIHAAETSSSYVVEGLLKFLISQEPEAIEMRNKYIFIILPILNPDGVVIGNSRCSAGGYDLNRCWNFPKLDQHPTIYGFKSLFQLLSFKKKYN